MQELVSQVLPRVLGSKRSLTQLPSEIYIFVGAASSITSLHFLHIPGTPDQAIVGGYERYLQPI